MSRRYKKSQLNSVKNKLKEFNESEEKKSDEEKELKASKTEEQPTKNKKSCSCC